MLAKPPGLALPCLALPERLSTRALPIYLNRQVSFIHSFIHSFLHSDSYGKVTTELLSCNPPVDSSTKGPTRSNAIDPAAEEAPAPKVCRSVILVAFANDTVDAFPTVFSGFHSDSSRRMFPPRPGGTTSLAFILSSEAFEWVGLL